jgi:hypothetical protein
MIELFSNFFLVHKNDISSLDMNDSFIYRLKSSNIRSTDVEEIVNKWINLKTIIIEYCSTKNIQSFLQVLFSFLLLKEKTTNNREFKDILSMNQCIFFD